MTTVEKLGLYLGIGAALVLLVLIFFSTNGFIDYRELKEHEIRINTQALLELRENSKIEKEINRLKYDLEYIRHMAKHEYGMAAPDELIFKKKLKAKEVSP